MLSADLHNARGELNLPLLLQHIIALVKQAGKEILQVAESCEIDIRCKQDNTPVTNADLAANQLIVRTLQQITPEIPVLSEETKPLSFSQRQHWQRYWLIDPLDGTREFIDNNGEYSINIALIEGHCSVLGVIYAPVQGVIYYANKGGGAYKIESLNAPQRIHVQNRVRDPIIVTCGNHCNLNKAYEDFIQRLGNVQFFAMGSSLKSCLVADGSADIYARLGPTSEWDTAAAQCIVEEAGGCLTDLKLNALRYNTKASLLNPEFLVFGDKTRDWKTLLSG